MVEVVIADPSFLTREGFKKTMEGENSYKIVGEIKNNKEIWFKLSSLNPDILVIDYDDKNFLDINEITKIKEYVPGYKLTLGPIFENGRVTIMNEVEGSGDYLPKYAGNLDIINCAAITVAEEYAKRKLGKL